MEILINILLLIFAYIFGSIPGALIIGKIFYKKDIREYGSHNLGGSNAIRTLGLIPGICVILFDSFKAFIYVFIVSLINPKFMGICGLIVCFGHCYPLFANFKGGKAVACSLGYVLALNVLLTHNILLGVIVPAIVFFITLLLSHYMSLSSMLSLTVANIIGYFIYESLEIKVLLTILNIFVVIKHRENIKRIINKNENRIF